MSRRYDDRFKIPKDIIIDCVCRFMLNPNSRILEDPIWFSSYLELAYWFYKDQYMDERPRELKNVSFQCFVEQAVQELKIPIPKEKTSAQLCAEFVEFKHRVNTYGGILVNPELNKVLLVQSFNGQSWGFPKGKIEENEVPVLCAIREVKEEIDYDMSPYINPDDFLEIMVLDQVTVLYVIHGVPENTPFKTNTRKEIGDIKWFDVDMLPLHKGDKKPLRGTNYTPNNFFITIPFVKAIREHLAEMRQRCVDTFRAPIYKQQCHMEYLHKYYPETYKICMQHMKETRQEQEERNKREEATKAAQRRVYRIPYSERTLRTDHQELMPKPVVAVQAVPEITPAEVPTILEMLQRAKTRSEGLELTPDPAASASTLGFLTNNTSEHKRFFFKTSPHKTGNGTGYSAVGPTEHDPSPPGSNSNVADGGARRRRRSSADNTTCKGGGGDPHLTVTANTMVFTNSNSSISNNVGSGVSNNKVQRSKSGRSKNRRSKRHSSGGNKSSNSGLDVSVPAVLSGTGVGVNQSSSLVSCTNTTLGTIVPTVNCDSNKSSGVGFGTPASKNVSRVAGGIQRSSTWATCQLNLDDVMAVVEKTWVQQSVATGLKGPSQPRQHQVKENQTRR